MKSNEQSLPNLLNGGRPAVVFVLLCTCVRTCAAPEKKTHFDRTTRGGSCQCARALARGASPLANWTSSIVTGTIPASDWPAARVYAHTCFRLGVREKEKTDGGR